ncbi:glycoside hydrolase family 35 protein [Mucilaginibacter boryungensis]|uniref:Beta-galactosidase n=1 Tax=Mucilaginibacter boryungensis TaxID=768480 RepID=A0ABR9XEW5_9SPHI|nr:beta-galactosidase family protein [Mucilaginibacter boryungensis]MBE9665720.1 beta-galactosidase [Mucilaginibacter boryungensis]
MSLKVNLKALLLAALITVQLQSRAQVKHTFAFGDTDFLLDSKPFQMISGEMHYPRVPREAWRARMKMAKAMGLNTIGTYVFWNLHEPQKGKFDFSGNNDVAEFVKIAQQEGLWVILRPSPYVCAEWEFGGYPYWLQNQKGLVVRSKDPQYLKEYETYIKEIGKQLAPLQINHGGNILMVQIENEYGSYGSDKEYLAINEKLFKEAGFDGLLYTCDPAADVAKGHLPGMLPAVNGIDNPARVRKIVNDNHSGKGPYYVAEWYPAWFDWWGTQHHTVPASRYSVHLDTVLAAGISINMYMFHGGTTRAFMNGANYKDTSPYEPQTSSYDYDAPLDEAGNATPKFLAFRSVIEKYLPKGKTLPPVPAAKPAMHINAIKLTQTGVLLSNLPVPRSSAKPLTFEDLNQAYGYVLYRTTLTGGKAGILKVKELRDYAVVMVNGKTVGTMDRRSVQDSLAITLPAGKVTLDILVENMGRVNFGKYLLTNKKGITEKVLFAGTELTGWKTYSLPFANLTGIKYAASNKGNTPAVKKGSFNLATVADTYLDMRTWGKGVVWVNGHNLGRYWSIGPQQTIYLPAEWLRKGVNSIEVLELLKPEQTQLSSLNKPILDQLR